MDKILHQLVGCLSQYSLVQDLSIHSTNLLPRIAKKSQSHFKLVATLHPLHSVNLLLSAFSCFGTSLLSDE